MLCASFAVPVYLCNWGLRQQRKGDAGEGREEKPELKRRWMQCSKGRWADPHFLGFTFGRGPAQQAQRKWLGVGGRGREVERGRGRSPSEPGGLDCWATTFCPTSAGS